MQRRAFKNCDVNKQSIRSGRQKFSKALACGCSAAPTFLFCLVTTAKELNFCSSLCWSPKTLGSQQKVSSIPVAFLGIPSRNHCFSSSLYFAHFWIAVYGSRLCHHVRWMPWNDRKSSLCGLMANGGCSWQRVTGMCWVAQWFRWSYWLKHNHFNALMQFLPNGIFLPAHCLAQHVCTDSGSINFLVTRVRYVLRRVGN